MKKILISAYACNPLYGSEFGTGWNWSYHVAKSGYDVYCFTTKKGQKDIETEHSQLNLPNLKFIYIEVPKWVDRLYAHQAGVYFHYFYWQHQAYKKAKILDREINFDIIHHVTYNSLQFGSELWKLNKPLVYGPSGGGQFTLTVFKKYFGSKWYQEIVRNWISFALVNFNSNTRNSVKKSHSFIASNEDTSKMASRLGAKKMHFMIDSVLPENLIETEYTPRESTDVLRLLWTGRVYPRKGLNLVLDVLGHLKGKIPFKLTIIGDGPLGRKVPEWIKQNDIVEQVEWKGRIPFSEVKAAYLNHDVFFFTSLRDSCPPQLYEAMANGLPIVTLNMHGTKTLVPSEAGIKVEPTTLPKIVEDLKNAIIDLYSNPKKREEMGRAGLDYAKSQTWRRRVKFVTEIYEEINVAK